MYSIPNQKGKKYASEDGKDRTGDLTLTRVAKTISKLNGIKLRPFLLK